MRSSTKDVDNKLTPPRDHTIESAIEWISEDRLVEVTPDSLRVQRHLDHNQRRAKAKVG
ncbi:MAG: hypothetical protein R3E12_14125 [Candidatus Eisenbacteria bacterium]